MVEVWVVLLLYGGNVLDDRHWTHATPKSRSISEKGISA